MPYTKNIHRFEHDGEYGNANENSGLRREDVRYKRPPLSRKNFSSSSHSSKPIIRHSSVKTDRPHFQRASTLVAEQSSEILNDDIEEPVNNISTSHNLPSALSSPVQSGSVKSSDIASSQASGIYDEVDRSFQSGLGQDNLPFSPFSDRLSFDTTSTNELKTTDEQGHLNNSSFSSFKPTNTSPQSGSPRLPLSRLNHPVFNIDNNRNRIVSEAAYPFQLPNKSDNYKTRSVSLPLHRSILDNTLCNSYAVDDSGHFSPVEDTIPLRKDSLRENHPTRDSRLSLLDYGSSSSSVSSTSGVPKPTDSSTYSGIINQQLSASENASDHFSVRERLRNRSSDNPGDPEKDQIDSKESFVLQAQVKDEVSKFMIFFTIGILFPPLWMIASFLPIPGTRTYKMRLKHIQWRFINRVVSCLGLAIIFLFIGLGVAGS
ncbi:hypothetical protein SPOG_02767 [Schizosaccharomyces cryophilus OY26]|uniref:Uncharacterized protein n=1 Tax=Schizosaccharomyces cryophilus (strain OY26 / ATCC MYA-4695 / CBS 11777 / NBRC 106824 / NRRL Y48691) TaxID=653667 RepID=S9W8A7_SCHCR|nr:uncharacterized protein SPOG_02767 [Schizosaccharomyces cryophilus OY26]EPY54010.1 hypothetical protein SPOG_02767 [Schizosaccharomyces cryophilus OY26]